MTKRASPREKALELLAGRNAVGAAFYDVAAEALVLGLGYRFGGVALLTADGKRVDPLAFCHRGGKGGEASYALADSPCRRVYRAKPDKSQVFLPASALKRFPRVAGIENNGLAAYRGEVFCGPDGRPVGHLFAASDSADADNADSSKFFQLVVERVEAEFKRWKAEETLKQSELRTRAAELRLRDAVENLSDGFTLFDSHDRLVVYNSRWLNLYGYSADEIRAGVRYEDLVRLDAARQAISGDVEAYVRQRLAYRRRFLGSFDLQLKDGRWITIRERETADGGIVGIQTDITDRMEAIELLLHEKGAAEQDAKAKAEDVVKISHELRTPLNAITGFGHVIRSASFGPIGNPRYQEYANDIVTAAEHVLDLVNGVLDRAGTESSSLSLQEEVIDVCETVRAALVFVREAAGRKRITVDLFLADDMPKLRADPRKLKQILLNLLANGIKFTESGGRVMVTVRSNRDEGFVFEIADTGPGIADEDIDHALREYGRVRAPGLIEEEGTGLGLPLAAALSELHGGTLEIDSVVGFGTLVTVVLPWNRAVLEEDPRRVRI